MYLLNKTLKTFFIAMTVLLWAQLSHGHSSHGSPLNEDQALVKATKDVGIIINKSEKVGGETLDASWGSVTDKKIFKKGLRYFIVSFHHAEQKKTLYVLLDIYGKYRGANFVGVFEGLKQ